jgi:hypothetical protein
VKSTKSARRQIFVLTREEKKTVSFVLIASLIGITVKHYREMHALPPRQTAIADTAKTVAVRAQKRAEAKRRKPAK